MGCFGCGTDALSVHVTSNRILQGQITTYSIVCAPCMTSGVVGRLLFYFVHRQGEDSSQDEKGASSILATQLDEELGGRAVQVTDDNSMIYSASFVGSSCIAALTSTSCIVYLLHI